MRLPGSIGYIVMLLACGLAAFGAAGPRGEDEMKHIAAMLPEKPIGVGRPVGDRAAWDQLAALDSFRKILREAEKLANEPIPEQPDDLYLEFSKTGNRTHWQNVADKRRRRVRVFALAECLENKGRFLAPLEKIVDTLCREPTWVMPAHDRSLGNFHGKTVDIDLASSALAWELATADDLLGDTLNAVTRKLIRDNVRRRVLDPFLAMVGGKRGKNWWLDTTNNWNPVCLAGVVGAALALVESPSERARFVAAARTYSANFLRGFGPDGYCTEGLGYWNYGFGRYTLMTETLKQATGGKLDLFEDDAVKAPAAFGARIEILNDVYPAFADCRVDVKPDKRLMAYVNRRYGLGLDRFAPPAPSADGALFESLLYSFPNSVSGLSAATPRSGGLEARTWFSSSGILIGRPGSAGSCRMGVALKGGHNAEHHNHNDLGSFVVVVGKAAVLLDPGPEIYTARTFSPKRYECKLLSSYGHPVPRVAGELQETGRQAQAKVLKTAFTDLEDTLVMDIASAYAVKELKKLTRTFVYSRAGQGSLTVTDEVEFSEPKAFGTALITLGEWEVKGPGRLRMTAGGESVRVEIAAGDAAFDIAAEEIREDTALKKPPTRIGLDLRQPVTHARVTLTIAAEAP